MKIIDSNFLRNGLVVHHYESNKRYFSKINFFYFSDDEKLVAAYWEAPRGWFNHVCNGFDEVEYIIDGEIELSLEDKKVTAGRGDCLLIKNGEKVKFRIKKFAKVIALNYPLNKILIEDIKKMIGNNNKIN